MKKYISSLLAIFLILNSINAASFTKFHGRIADSDGKPLIGVNVMLKENMIGTATDEHGNFYLEVPTGEFTLFISHIGYEQVEEKIKFIDNKEVIRNYSLKIEYFNIGGIKVYADKKLLTNDLETKTSISSSEIEHIQATSLSDVLKLVPGQRFENPGLEDKKQAIIRQTSTGDLDEQSFDDDNSATMGTQIIVDNIPLSNNANMQIETKANAGSIERTTSSEGLDLRQIPADNIEKIEVIRGIPSAKYGDLTSGIIKVETKSTSLEQRFKYKYNLRNKEFNLNGGFKLFDQFLNYNFNYANSSRDIRIEEYDYSRISGQLSHTAYLFKNLYTMKNKLYYTRTFDEQGLREDDVLQKEKFNRDFILRYNHNSTYLLNQKQKLEMAYSINYNRQNSYGKGILLSDNTYLTDRMTEGTQQGQYYQNGIYELWVKGKAINQYLNFEYFNTMVLSNLQHNISSGLSLRHEANHGKGRIFDLLSPPELSDEFRDRPRSYDDIPALMISSFYMEDKIKGQLWKKFQLSVGARFESYGTDNGIFTSDHGSYINPRVNLLIYTTENSQLRVGFGATSKAPTLSMLYPNPVYFDVADINQYSEVDSLRLAVVSTYIYDARNKNLKGSQQFKREISFHQKVGNVGWSITGYLNNMENGFAKRKLPVFAYKYDYPNWTQGNPDMSEKTVYDSVVSAYNQYTNSRVSESKGLELSLQTNPITPLKMKFRIEASYNITNTKNNDYLYTTSNTQFTDTKTGRKVIPFFNTLEIESENLLINYRMEFKIKELGTWVTIESQQVVFDKNRYYGYKDSIAVGYFNDQGEKIFFADEERTSELSTAFIKVYPDYKGVVEEYSNIWLFNLRVSKSLSKSFEVSFFVNNFFNSHPLVRKKRVASGQVSYNRLNPDLFFGIEFSGVINDLF